MSSRRGGLAREASAPGAALLFVLRAIGLIMLARWLYAMSSIGFLGGLEAMSRSLWACGHACYLFLLLVLPGAKPSVERPFQPLPRWLRRVLRLFALVAFFFSMFFIVQFFVQTGTTRLAEAIMQSNGWLVLAPALYLAVVWLCRPRARWRNRPASGQFAIGRFAVLVDFAARQATVWDETRRLGRYALDALSIQRHQRFGRGWIELRRRNIAPGPAGTGGTASDTRLFTVLEGRAERRAAERLSAAFAVERNTLSSPPQ
ncbi:MAG: hypothetical protein ACRYG5_12055 [Janthinobacterium lividum]